MGLLDKPVHREVNGAGATDVVDESALAAFGCDVAFVGDDATPAETLVAAAVEQTAELHLKHVLRDVFDRLRGQYESGGMVSHPSRVQTQIAQAAAAGAIELPAEQIGRMHRFF